MWWKLTGIVLALMLIATTSKGTPAKLALCEACHGKDGASQTPTTPSLKGQQAVYTYNQLIMFKKGTRVSVMNGIVAGFSDKELKELAEYFSKKECK